MPPPPADQVIDSHCHLQTLEPGECARALDRARERGVRGFLVPAITLADAERLLELAAGEKDVWCALGVHPHEARTWRPGHDRLLADLLTEPEVVAVGECGLDFHYDLSPRDVQLRVMRAQWEIASSAGLPVVVHNRASNSAMRQVLRDSVFAGSTGVFHSFAGGRRLGREVVAAGFSLGFSGMVTFPAAENVREMLPLTPLDRVLVETDTPYLAPVPFRGRASEPAHVVEVAERLARELDSTLSALCAQTTENFFRLFPRARAS